MAPSVSPACTVYGTRMRLPETARGAGPAGAEADAGPTAEAGADAAEAGADAADAGADAADDGGDPADAGGDAADADPGDAGPAAAGAVPAELVLRRGATSVRPVTSRSASSRWFASTSA